MRILLAIGVLATLTIFGSLPAVAEADGPDKWDVSGVRSDDTLNMHAEPNARSRTIARIPHDARGLVNRGCQGTPSFQQWTKMSPAQRERASRARWCRVTFDGKTGWVAGRFLKESSGSAGPSAPRTVGPWTIRCGSASCVIEQTGIAATRRTVFRVEPVDSVNARIVIERAGLPRKGTMSIYMDGDQIMAGPIEQLRSKTGSRFVLEPDDITGGLLKQMARHKNMVVSFPGAERGVEFHLDQFSEARKAEEAQRPNRK